MGKNALKASKWVRINTATAKIERQATKGIRTKKQNPVKASKKRRNCGK